MFAVFISLSIRSHGVAACLSQSPKFAGCFSLSTWVPWSYYMSFAFSYGCLLSLTVSLVPWSCYMSLTVSYNCWLSLTVSPSAMELLHVCHCLLWLLADSHSLFDSMHGVAICLSLSLIVSGCLSLCLPVPWSYCKFLTLSRPWLRAFSNCLSFPMELLNFFHCLPWLLAFSKCHSSPMEMLHVSH